MDPITDVLVEQLYNTIANEHQLWNAFQSQVDILKKRIEVMKSFQADHGLKGTEKNQTTLKTILDQVRDLVYDADDLLLDCQTRAAYEKITCLGFYTPRGISFRYNAVHTLKDLNSQIADTEKRLAAYGHMTTNADEGISQGRTNHLRRTSPALGHDKIIGLEKDTEKIIGYVTRNENSSCTGIVGMGGLGKTTLASKVYNHQTVIKHFDKRIWVSVTQKFNTEDIETNMLKQLPSDDGSGTDAMSKIQESLKNQKYLIVMDDVWNLDTAWWEKLSQYLPQGEQTKKSIIITTRNEEYAKRMAVTYIHRARELDKGESWELFSGVAFGRMDKSMSGDPKFRKIGEEIVAKCDGLPLSIKTIAGQLRSKESSLRDWETVKRNFYDVLANKTPAQGVLQLSYDDLPPRLKQCILSFSIYPEGSEIDAEQLKYWWVGEGFVHGNGENTAIEEASQCLSDLVNRCLVGVTKQRGYDGRVTKCKMHDMVRDLIIRMSIQEAFRSFDVRNKQNPDPKSRHLGYTSQMDDNMENNSKLRAFILMKHKELPSLRRSRLATINSFRVLDLSQNEQERFSVKDLLRWLKDQKRLAYLNLRKLHDLKRLPKWIRKHQNLKILVIKECINLRKLPSCVTSLQNLIVLDVDNCALENLPQGLGKLTKLEVLSGFKLGGPGKDGARFRDLKGLEVLRVLRIQLSEKDDILDEDEGILSELRQLKVLSIDIKDCGENQAELVKTHVELVKKLVPPPSLLELYLSSYTGEATPDWVTPSKLPKLLYLYIDAAPITSVSNDFWGSDENAWKIEGLCFKHLPVFQMKWGDVKEKMKYLRYVEVSRCPVLQSFPINDVKTYGVWVKDDFEQGFQNQEGKVSTEGSTTAAESESL